MSQIERRGRPTALWTASQFVEDARWSALLWGRPEVGIVEIPECITNNSPDNIARMVDAGIARVVEVLTEAAPQANPEFAHVTRVADPELRYEGADLLDAAERMNEAFVDNHWSDGFPLVPPTRPKVDAMVAASGLPAAHVLGVFDPGFGIGTIEKIAANAVMAGCKPEMMPVVRTACECLLDPRIDARLLTMSTSFQAAAVLVSGPYARQIGLNSGVCAIGPGSVSRVNVAIGRAMQLVRMNVGHSYPGVSDMDTQGSTLKFGYCVAENEARNPWEPWRVQRGFSRETSTATVYCVESAIEVHDFENHEPGKLVEVFCTALTAAGYVGIGAWLMSPQAATEPGGPSQVRGDNTMMIFLCPDHAMVFKRAGWSIADIQQALHRGTRMPFRQLMLTKTRELFERNSPQLAWLADQPETLVQAYAHPGVFEIFVVGGDAGWSTVHYGGSYSVTREIQLPEQNQEERR